MNEQFWWYVARASGLVAWGLGRMLPSGGASGEESASEDDAPPSSTLGLFD